MWNSWIAWSSHASPRREQRWQKALQHQRINKLYAEDNWAPARMVLLSAVLGSLGLVVVVISALLSGYFYFARGLPDPSFMTNRQLFQSVLFYDRNGQRLYELFDPNGGRRTLTHLEDLPPLLIDATLAAEDPNFWTNPGFDVLATGRALLQNFQHRSLVSGASTLTQQLARNILFTPEERTAQTLDRKLREAIYAIWLTETYPKDQILETFFNEVYYGNLSYGVAAAARSYFGKDVKDLTLAECALLAGLPQAPSDYDPIHHLDLAKARQAYVLDRMVVHGHITEQEAKDAEAAPLTFADQSVTIRAPHFVYYVKDLIEQRYGHDALYNSGWTIQTTIDLNLQAIAEKDARARIAEIKDVMNAHNSAIVAIQPSTGEVLTMLGSLDYWDNSIQGQVNVATSLRQPGSSIKPFNYVTGFNMGYSPNSKIDDVKTCFAVSPSLPPYCPANFQFQYNGQVMLKEALASSLNIPAVKLLSHVGVEAMANTAHAFGITSLRNPYRYGLTLTLGASEVTPLDLTFAYSVFANDGNMIGEPVPLQDLEPGMREYEPVAVLKITDPSGKVVYQYTPPAPKQVYSPQAAWLVTTSISDDHNRRFTFAPGGPLVIDRPAAVKTGTTQFLQDTWTVGYTPDLVVGVWVGNTDGTAMRQISGVVSAATIWHNFIIDAQKYLQLPPRDFVQPPGVAYGQVCGNDGWYIVGRSPVCYVS